MTDEEHGDHDTLDDQLHAGLRSWRARRSS